jgi:hypothetical protein
VESAVREYLRMQQPGFYRDGIFKLVLTVVKFYTVNTSAVLTLLIFHFRQGFPGTEPPFVTAGDSQRTSA